MIRFLCAWVSLFLDSEKRTVSLVLKVHNTLLPFETSPPEAQRDEDEDEMIMISLPTNVGLYCQVQVFLLECCTDFVN